MNTLTLSSVFIPSQITLPHCRIFFSAALPLSPVVVKICMPMKLTDEKAKRPPRGITKPKHISETLEEIVGVKKILRTQVLKVIWDYIKEHNLQDPDNKKIIVCDEKLKAIFAGKDRVGFLEISGLLNSHFAK